MDPGRAPEQGVTARFATKEIMMRVVLRGLVLPAVAVMATLGSAQAAWIASHIGTLGGDYTLPSAVNGQGQVCLLYTSSRLIAPRRISPRTDRAGLALGYPSHAERGGNRTTRIKASVHDMVDRRGAAKDVGQLVPAGHASAARLR